MYCLWNGEYGEHDLSFVPSLETNLRIQSEQYPQYVGCVVGDFTCEKVEYDWGRHDQRWTCRCNLCGRVIYQYHTNDWRRGKGRKTTCDCRAAQAERERREKAEEKKAEKQNAIDCVLGKTYNGWTVVEYGGGKSCTVKCKECGKEKHICGKRNFEALVGFEIKPCSHQEKMDFTGDEWIGKRNGHLTVIDRSGKDFIAKCDCGREVVVKPTFLFRYKNRRDCGYEDCPYSTPMERKSRERRKKGFKFESDVEQMLVEKGYNAKKTQDQADYGVDVVITNEDGSKIAVQCKKQSVPAGVSAIQEVYAGGRYYDCDKFAVICESGFSSPAINMARKLGVYLCFGEFEYPDDIDRFSKALLPTHRVINRDEKLYEVNGVKKTMSAWGAEYRIPPKVIKKRMELGYHLEDALKMPYKYRGDAL